MFLQFVKEKKHTVEDTVHPPISQHQVRQQLRRLITVGMQQHCNESDSPTSPKDSSQTTDETKVLPPGLFHSVLQTKIKLN